MKKKRTVTFIAIGCTSMLCFILVLFVFNPFALVYNVVRVSKIKTEFPAAETRWQSSQIADYEMDVEGFVPLSCYYNAHLVVRRGQIYSIEVGESIFEENSPLKAVEPTNRDTPFGCSYSELTVDSMFDRVGESLDIDVLETSLEVRFDSQYGYVTYYEIRYDYITGGVSDSCIWFRFSNFHPMTR